MADTTNKRASTSARVAVPRVNSPQSSQILANDESIARNIGAKIKVTLSKPSKSFEGYLFNAHIPSNILLLTSSWPPPADRSPALTTLFLGNIQSVSILTPAQASAQKDPAASRFPPLPPSLDTVAQQSKIQSAISRLEAEEAKKGKGVSKEAQDIFDAFAKTYDCRWEGENIIVMNQVVIEKPYSAGDIKGLKEKSEQAVVRFRKMLDIEKKKIAERGNGAVPAGGQRKGG